MKKISFRKKIKPCVLSKEDLLQLAQIAYSLWQDDINVANDEWEKKKLPELISGIKEHNKALKAHKISYFAKTSLPIEDPAPIIEEEKRYFIHTTKGFYEWRSNFKLYFKDKTITSTSPEILSEELDTEKIKNLEFWVSSVKQDNAIKVFISQVNDNSYYEIEGEDEVWVRSIKDRLNDIFTDKEVPNGWLHKDIFQFPTSVVLSAAGVFTVFTLLKKVSLYQNNLPHPLVLWVSIFLGFIIFLWFLKIFWSTLGNKFPYLQLEQSQSITTREEIIGLLALGVVTNAVYELIIWIFK